MIFFYVIFMKLNEKGRRLVLVVDGIKNKIINGDVLEVLKKSP